MIIITSMKMLGEVLSKSEGSFIYVSASWCIDCKVTNFNLEHTIKDVKSNFYVLDYDEYKLFCEEYKIIHLPTLLYCKEGEIINKYGDGNSLNHELITKFINKYQGE